MVPCIKLPKPKVLEVRILIWYFNFSSNFPKLYGQILAFRKKQGTKYPFHIDLDMPNKCFAQVPTMQSHAITWSLFNTKSVILGYFQWGSKFRVFWDFHESKRYPCTQKISSLALKLTILGLKNFMGKILILGTPFQPLCYDTNVHAVVSRQSKHHRI